MFFSSVWRKYCHVKHLSLNDQQQHKNTSTIINLDTFHRWNSKNSLSRTCRLYIVTCLLSSFGCYSSLESERLEMFVTEK